MSNKILLGHCLLYSLLYKQTFSRNAGREVSEPDGRGRDEAEVESVEETPFLETSQQQSAGRKG